MQESKHLKDFTESDSWIFNISSIVDRPFSYIRNIFRSIKRSYEYAKFGWSNEDYDYNYLLKLIEFKLIRLQDCISNGHHIPDKATDQSIRICIKLLKKLAFKDSSYFTNLHYTKWGQPELLISEPDAKGLCGVEIKHKNVITDEDKEKQTQEFLEAYKKDEEQELRDVRLLFSIMAKYHKRWWD